MLTEDFMKVRPRRPDIDVEVRKIDSWTNARGNRVDNHEVEFPGLKGNLYGNGSVVLEHWKLGDLFFSPAYEPLTEMGYSDRDRITETDQFFPNGNFYADHPIVKMRSRKGIGKYVWKKVVNYSIEEGTMAMIGGHGASPSQKAFLDKLGYTSAGPAKFMPVQEPKSPIRSLFGLR